MGGMVMRKPLTKEQLQDTAEKGGFLYGDYKCFADMDGRYAADYLTQKGFEIERHYDCGYNGWAITKCGIWLSTNGFIIKREAHENEKYT